MPSSLDTQLALQNLSQELDLLVYRLELTPAEEPEKLLLERVAIRVELERLRDELDELAHSVL